MVKKFTTTCRFEGGQQAPVTFYVGDAHVGVHPLAFQSKWLSKERGGSVPDDIMESFSKLKDIADSNKVSFEELCGFVIDEINSQNSLAGDIKKSSEFTNPDKKD